jgi:hypothetical protein
LPFKRLGSPSKSFEGEFDHNRSAFDILNNPNLLFFLLKP